jgi:hypothetical protein
MPLTKKGKKVLASMKGHYGKGIGERVFYASMNAGKIPRRKMEHKSK